MKKQLKMRCVVLMTLVLTAVSILSNVDRGGCQIPISPGTLVFARFKTTLVFQIFSMSTKGNNLQRLTQTNVDELHPSWSPDGSRIIFVSGTSASPTFTLTMMLADGSQRTTLFASPIRINRPVWSPDGRWIAFGMGTALYVMDMNAKKRIPIVLYNGAPFGTACLPSWRRDSWRIAFTYVNFSSQLDDILCINVDGSGLQNLTNTPNANEGNPAWSPDGNSIAYVRGHSKDFFTEDLFGEIYLMNPDGSNHRQATYTGGTCFGTPAWSPDGEMIAFSAPDSGGQFKLFTTVPTSGNAIQMTFGFGDDRDPAWKR